MSMNDARRYIFLTYEQYSSPYVETYFLHLFSKMGCEIEIYQLCSNSPDNDISEVKQQFENIHWYVVPMRGSTKAGKILRSLLLLRKKILERHRKADNLIFRSIAGGFFGGCLRLSGVSYKRYIYDSDGLAIDERLEFKAWRKNSVLTLFARFIEICSLKFSDGIIVRSTNTITALKKRYRFVRHKKFTVLINGRPKEIFTVPESDQNLNYRLKFGVRTDSLVLLYVGSIGPQYLFEEIAEIFHAIKKITPLIELVIATISDDETVTRYLPKTLESDKENVHVLNLAPTEIMEVVSFSDVGICLRADSESMKHVAPLKLREYLLAGLPVIYTDNTGDNFSLPSSFAHVFAPSSEVRISSLIAWWEQEVIINSSLNRLRARQFALKHLEIQVDSRQLLKFLKTI